MKVNLFQIILFCSFFIQLTACHQEKDPAYPVPSDVTPSPPKQTIQDHSENPIHLDSLAEKPLPYANPGNQNLLMVCNPIESYLEITLKNRRALARMIVHSLLEKIRPLDPQNRMTVKQAVEETNLYELAQKATEPVSEVFHLLSTQAKLPKNHLWTLNLTLWIQKAIVLKPGWLVAAVTRETNLDHSEFQLAPDEWRDLGSYAHQMAQQVETLHTTSVLLRLTGEEPNSEKEPLAYMPHMGQETWKTGLGKLAQKIILDTQYPLELRLAATRLLSKKIFNTENWLSSEARKMIDILKKRRQLPHEHEVIQAIQDQI